MMKNQKMMMMMMILLIIIVMSVIVIAVQNKTEIIDIFNNKTVFYHTIVKDSFINDSCGISPINGSVMTCVYEVERSVDYNVTTSEFLQQSVKINNKVYDMNVLNVWCYEDGEFVVCKSNADGDGWLRKKGVSAGMSYFVIDGNDKIDVYGHLKGKLEKVKD